MRVFFFFFFSPPRHFAAYAGSRACHIAAIMPPSETMRELAAIRVRSEREHALQRLRAARSCVMLYVYATLRCARFT